MSFFQSLFILILHSIIVQGNTYNIYKIHIQFVPRSSELNIIESLYFQLASLQSTFININGIITTQLYNNLGSMYLHFKYS